MRVCADEIKEGCKARWTVDNIADEKVQFFDSHFSEWLNQFKECFQDMVLVLIDNMLYISRPTANQWLQTLHKELVTVGVTDEDTIYTFIKSQDGLTNSSNDYWTEYKAINHVNKNICYEDICAIQEKQWEYIKNIVLIDDFSGSGKSIEDFISSKLDLFTGKRIICITVCVMEAAKKRLEEFGVSNGMQIVVLTGIIQKRAFEQSLFEDDDRAKDELIQVSTELRIPPKDHLGFCDNKTHEATQSLIAFYNNTPNNTIGIMRYDVEGGYFSIFPRVDDKKPSWQKLREKKKGRKATNYMNSKKGNE